MRRHCIISFQVGKEKTPFQRQCHIGPVSRADPSTYLGCALERQDLSPTYLAHHELESVIIIIIIIITLGVTALVSRLMILCCIRIIWELSALFVIAYPVSKQ